MRIVLASCLLLAGCHLDELLAPSAPPEKCFRTIVITFVNSWGDTTVVRRGVETPCEETH